MVDALVSWVAAVLLAAGGSGSPSQGSPGDRLSEPVRRAIAQRMVNHAVDLTDLLKAVVILDHDAVVDRVRAIHEEPKLSRPPPHETDTLNAAIPKHFFELQDDLIKKTAAVEEAAKTHDDVKMGKAFGQLAESCVTCHRVYLWRSSSGAR